MTSRMQDRYKNEVVKALLASGKYSNPHQVPRLVKVVVHMGVNTAVQKANKSALEEAMAELAMITGQKPTQTVSKHSISNFNLRRGQAIGCRVTLRGTQMYEFLDRFISAALPSVRDFRGVPNRGFDGRGSYSMGINDQTIFPEIELDKIKRQQGMDITIVTTARDNVGARELLKQLGMPFATVR